LGDLCRCRPGGLDVDDDSSGRSTTTVFTQRGTDHEEGIPDRSDGPRTGVRGRRRLHGQPRLRRQGSGPQRADRPAHHHHAEEATGGKTYAELGRYLAKSGGDTNDEAAAVKGADGKPLANPVRNVAFQASSLCTSLLTSVMAFNVAQLVVGLGAMMAALGIAVGGVGVALAGLAIPRFARKVHVYPAAADSQAA
jgi:hypothetical protein